MKIADVEFFWKRSPSSDAVKVDVTVTNDGEVSSLSFGPEVETLAVVMKPLTSCKVELVVTDSEGMKSAPVTYVATMGDLEDPQPVSDVGHRVLAIRDVPDVVPTP